MAMCVMAVAWRRSVPMLLSRREPDHVTWPDFLDRSAPALRPAATGGHDEGLAQRMSVPGGTRARLESDAGPLRQCRIGRLKKRIDTYRAGKPLGRALARRLRANSLDVHLEFLRRAAAQRPVIRSSFSGYRAPSTVIFEAASSMS